MITLISATHRPGSYTRKIAVAYRETAEKLGVNVQMLSLEDLPGDFLNTDYFGKRSGAFGQILSKYIEPVTSLVFIVPEYNGSFPGILKSFIDAMPFELLAGKKAALVGVATGRGGNVRGLDQLVGILHYLKVNVYFDKIPVSQVHLILDEKGRITDPKTLKLLQNQVRGFLNF